MVRSLLITLFILILNNALLPDEAGVELTIEVTNIKDITGKIHIGVFGNSADYLAKTNQVRKGSYAVSDKTLTVTYQGLKPGEYAIILFQDKNGNDINDANAIGIPQEPFGLSNNAQPGFGLPPFEKTKFKIGLESVKISVALQFFKKRWSIGVASIVSATPYVGGKVNFVPIPAIAYQGDKLDVFGHMIKYSLYHDNHLNFALAGRLNFDGYNNEDDEFFEGMDDRKYTFEVGAEFKYSFCKKWFVSTDIYGDPFGVSHGIQGSVDTGRTIGKEKWKLTPTLGFEWQNDNYNDYYYGVQEDESTSDRKEYHPGYSFSPTFACSYLRFWGESWAGYIKVKTCLLDDSLQDSPLIEKYYSFNILAAFVYRF